MTIPKSVTINGCIIPVNLVHNLFRDTGGYGEYKSSDSVINIDAEITDFKKKVFLVHEVIEAVKDLYLISDEDLNHCCIQPIALAMCGLCDFKQVP